LVLGLKGEEDSDFAMFDSTIAEAEIEAEDIDSMVAKELSSLSMQDLEKVYNDVHCLPSEIPESPELIQECLAQLALELDKIPEKTAYDLARSMDSNYVENVKFRLQFLRADGMDPAPAAARLVRHFQAKLELFGMSLLARDITQDDLDEETLAALYDGTGQILPVRDRAGRLVMVSFGHPSNISVTAKLKRVFYGIMVNVEDVETQRKGCVALGYLVGQSFSWSELSHRRAWNAKLSSVLSNVLPIRVDAFHFCHDSFVWKTLLGAFKIAATMSRRLRIREHYGTHAETMVYLQSFGIPIHVFPLSSDETLLVDSHVERWTRRRAWERQRRQAVEICDPGGGRNRGTSIISLSDEASSLRVDVPGREDVLLGRGRPTYLHPGNIRLRNLIELRSNEYDNSTLAKKQRITNDIIQAIHELTGRFLKDDCFGWVEVDDTVAKKKVAHAFRTLRQSRKAVIKSSR
jgi:hypothetical protein